METCSPLVPFVSGLPEEPLQQLQPARGAGAAGDVVPGSLHLSHQDSSGGHGPWCPGLAGGCRAAPGQSRDGPARLWQRSVCCWASLGMWDVLESQM